MIKVLHIVLGLQVGGLERFVLDLIEKYSTNVKPFIVCLELKGELGQRIDNIDVFELDQSPGLSFKNVFRISSIAKELSIDIIHTHNPAPHFYGAIAGFLTRIPVVHTKHGRNYPTDPKKVLLNRISSLLTDRIVAVSQNAAEVALHMEKIPSTKVTVILNGIDTDKFHPLKSKDEKMSGIVRIGIVARLSAEKDHQTLLTACELLTTNINNFHLDIIGDGPLRGSLEKIVKELGLDTLVTFCGVRHDVPELLRNLDVFVLSSTTEGISLTLLEAMATELPVVATDVGGNPEVVVDSETGYIVQPQDPKEMAAKLLLLIKDADLRRRMGGNGRMRVLERFSINESVRQYEELYRYIMDKR